MGAVRGEAVSEKQAGIGPKGLPKRIYVKRETDQNDKESTWLEANETTDSMEHGDTVGIYELKETRTLSVTRALK
jgi:hypothetical protein